MEHAAFHRGFIWVALGMALLVGFSIGAHLTAVLGLGFAPGRGFVSFIQTHGHVQLVGWAGLFIMGISLHVLPRLAGVRITRRWITCGLWLMTCGLSLRSLGHSVLPYLAPGIGFDTAMGMVVVSGVLEGLGILLYVALIGRIMRAARAHDRVALGAIKPYVGSMLAGWVVYASLNAGLLIDMALHARMTVDPTWNRFAIEAFTGLVLLPVAFAFSVRFMPFYLRLAVPGWSVRGIAYAYVLGWILEVMPSVPPFVQAVPKAVLMLSHIGMGLKAMAIVGLVWRLQVLTCWRTKPQPTRPEVTGKEAFGRFDWLIYSAYIWLVLAACSEIAVASLGLAGAGADVSPDAIRHLYMLGFITLLIFGVAVRMLPGLLKQRRVASPGLVAATFWLGNAAVLSRVLLVGMPPRVWQAVPVVVTGARTAYAISGMLGLAAVFCLAANLWRTAKVG
ncbi:MAG: hypothetical protein OEU26_03345 [Candidatus Tectomicrobia bacterium]|nr:hypothetical protein [Candidatus Tectomicrobia bacterium]